VNGWVQSAKRAHIWTFPQSAPSAILPVAILQNETEEGAPLVSDY